jgi:hypothetical protein
MGSFFSNIHIRTGDAAAVRAWLDGHLRDGGFARCTPEDADRTLVIDDREGWVSIYDSEAQHGDTGPSRKLLKALTRSLDTVGVSATVHDSDVLLLDLYRQGKRLDHFDSWPGYFEGKPRKVKPKRHVKAWSTAFPGTEEALSQCFSAEPTFAEAALAPLGLALGIEAHRLAVGVQDWSHSQHRGEVEVLSVRAVVRPAHERAAVGPPRLLTPWQIAEHNHGTVIPDDAVREVEAAEGAELNLHLSTRNVGGPGTGVSVRVVDDSGKADWRSVRLVLGNPRPQQVVEAPLVRAETVWRADLAEVLLPRGVPIDLQPTGPADMIKVMEAQLAAQVHVAVQGTARRGGKAQATVQVRPQANPGGGTSVVQPYAVRSTAHRPLRAPASVHPSMLAPLERPTRVVGMLAMTPSSLAQRLPHILQAIGNHLPTHGFVTTAVYPAPKGGLLGALKGGPKVKTGRKALQFTEKGKVLELVVALDRGAELAEATWVEGDPPEQPLARIEAGRGLLAPPSNQAVVVVTLPATDRAERALTAAFDRECTEAGLYQGFVTRWETAGSADSTPYELACGVHGQCTLSKAWLKRWLRGLGKGTLWLGPALLDHLEALPAGTQQGPMLRVTVHDVQSVERVLAPILPDGQAWRDGMQSRYEA